MNDLELLVLCSLTTEEPMKRSRVENSDSEEEPIRFPSRKETMSAANKQTRNTMRRLARLVDSDSSSNEASNKDEKESSDAEDDKKNKSSNGSESDSDESDNVKKPVRRRIKRMQESGDDSSEEDDDDKKKSKDKKNVEDQNTRKKIRNVWNKESLADATKAAAKEEEDRKKRIAERQKLVRNHVLIYTFIINLFV